MHPACHQLILAILCSENNPWWYGMRGQLLTGQRLKAHFCLALFCFIKVHMGQV